MQSAPETRLPVLLLGLQGYSIQWFDSTPDSNVADKVQEAARATDRQKACELLFSGGKYSRCGGEIESEKEFSREGEKAALTTSSKEATCTTKKRL